MVSSLNMNQLLEFQKKKKKGESFNNHTMQKNQKICYMHILPKEIKYNKQHAKTTLKIIYVLSFTYNLFNLLPNAQSTHHGQKVYSN